MRRVADQLRPTLQKLADFLDEAREIIAQAHGMIPPKTAAELLSWIERASASRVASSARALRTTKRRFGRRSPCVGPKDRPRSRSRASNSKYGHGKIDLLPARPIGAERSELHQNCVRANIAVRMTIAMIA